MPGPPTSRLRRQCANARRGACEAYRTIEGGQPGQPTLGEGMTRYRVLALAGAAAVALSAASAWAAGTPSAKVTYTYAELAIVVEAQVACDSYDGNDCASISLEDLATGSHRVLHATIKMPRHKGLLIDVSMECGNFLDMAVGSKGGDKDRAAATVRVLVLVNDGTGWDVALPSGNTGRDLDGDGDSDRFTSIEDGVVFCHRLQGLESRFHGIFASNTDLDGFIGGEDGDFHTVVDACEAGGVEGQACSAVTLVGTCLYKDPDSIKIFADLECFEPGELRLITAGMTANAFTFMYPNTTRSGVHEIAVIAYLDAGAGLDGDTPSGESITRAMIGLGSMSVETVRMIRGANVMSQPIDCNDIPNPCAELD